MEQALHTNLRIPNKPSKNVPPLEVKSRGPVDCCCVQGVQCCASAVPSLFCLVAHLRGLGKSLVVMLPSELENDEHVLAEANEACPQLIFYASADSLLRHIQSFRPRCILLSSHDKRFASLRRHSNSIRWCHENARCYDPHASRCSTPLYSSGSSLRKLPGYVGLAASFYSFDYLKEVECAYTPGPIRILGIGPINEARSNFKAFQTLSEKHPSILFVWQGANRNKQWMNIQLYTPTTRIETLMSSCDYLVWCADDDLCPISVFTALFLGLRVMLFEKMVSFNLTPLTSDTDGSKILSISNGAPQHAPIHTVTKNPKRVEDIIRAREYASSVIAEPPQLLVERIQKMTSDEQHVTL